MNQENDQGYLDGDILVGSTSAFLWDEDWAVSYPIAGNDDVKIDVSIISGREPRSVELCFDWKIFQPDSYKSIYAQDGCEYESPAIPLQFTPETAIQLGRLLIEAGERCKKNG